MAERCATYMRGKAYNVPKDVIKQNIEKREFIQHNATDKFMYLFLRYCHHFYDSELFFNEDIQKMQVILSRQENRTDNIIYELDGLVTKGLDSKER